MRPNRQSFMALFACLLCGGAFAVSLVPAAAATEGQVCIDAARRAAATHGVPLDVLIALTMTETATSRDGTVQPWPWAVNDAGTSHWFASKDAALRYAYKRLKEGAKNFDVGCFQLNFRWHSEAFASLDEMFDPVTNADYAARFLKSHYVETRDWSVAAGRYHSRTQQHASRYREIFDRYRSQAADHAAPRTAQAPQTPRHSVGGLAALAAPAGYSTAGSLVSLVGQATPLLTQGRRLF